MSASPSFERALRPLPLSIPAPIAAGNVIATPLVAALVLAAVASQLTVSANLLVLVGIDYNTPGGLPLVKLHPSTYLTIAAVIALCVQDGRLVRTFRALLEREPLIAWTLGGFTCCMVYFASSLGMSGGAIYVESYLAPALLALVCGASTPRQMRRLGWMMLALCTISQPLAILETIFHFHVAPLQFGAQKVVVETASDWRGVGLFDHALTGAMMMEMTAVLLLAMPIRPPVKIAMLALLLVSMVSFGGRTALAVTLLLLLGFAVLLVFRGLLLRTLEMRTFIAVAVGVVMTPVAIYALITETVLGSRLAQHFYADDSASARVAAWWIPGLETPRELLFGTTADRQIELIMQIGLQAPLDDIENFWLLSLVNLGIFGFILYLIAFLPFLYYLWARASLFGRVVLVTTILVASSSNSLARKSNILFVLVATVFAIRGFSEEDETASSPLGQPAERPMLDARPRALAPLSLG